MDLFRWDEGKNILLKQTRGIGFEEIEEAILKGDILANLRHPNEKRYPRQRIFVVALNGYAYSVPYIIEEENTYFLKTVYPNRAMTKRYLRQAEE